MILAIAAPVAAQDDSIRQMKGDQQKVLGNEDRRRIENEENNKSGNAIIGSLINVV